MGVDRLLRWLSWIAVILLTLYVYAIGWSILTRPPAPPPIPDEHQLFHYW